MISPLQLLTAISLVWGVSASSPRQIAVIGAGAGGSSTAFHLDRFAKASGVLVNITLFEASGRVGGRTLTVDAHGNESWPLELGASIFVQANAILYGAAHELGLETQTPKADAAVNGLLLVWDGERVVYSQDNDSWGWWNLARLVWRYGLAPYRTRTLVRASLDTFLKLYQPPYFPFRLLTQRVFELGLQKLTGVTGEQFLAANNISPAFAKEIIQASTRVNYASNLGYIHGLETMVCMAPENAMSVKGGNWRIFDGMLRACNASCTVLRNTPISTIGFAPAGDKTAQPRYALSTRQSSDPDAIIGPYPVSFDSVVIAAPWQFTGIKADDGILQRAVEEIPYMKLHVTIFTSPHRLSRDYFGISHSPTTPVTVLTTLAEQDEPQPGGSGVGAAGFYSVSVLRAVQNPRTGLDEFVYKIFSPEAVTPDLISKLLDVNQSDVAVAMVRAQKRSRNQSQQGEQGGQEAVDEGPVTWYLAHVFHSYPIEYPRVTFQDPVLGHGIYYTSGIESFISTMETSALMGMNVARLVVDDFLEESPSHSKVKEMAGTVSERWAPREEL